jgi:hypothetical protein
MSILREAQLLETRRQFFGRTATGIGSVALASLMNPEVLGATASPLEAYPSGIVGAPHVRPTAKRVIYMCMSGGPSQLDMWDYKPQMKEWFDKDLPDSVRMGQRITTMTSGQTRFPCAPSKFKFAQHGQCGRWVSELLPHTSSIVDDLCVIKSMHTEAINHDPAITFLQTGSQLPGRPSLGAWLSYGIGSENNDLPGFVVLHSSWSSKQTTQALYSRLWGAGFLPSEHQGCSLQSTGDPVLYLSNPEGVSPEGRRRMLDGLAKLNQRQFEVFGDPEINTRIRQYEMAYRMQSSVPEFANVGSEPQSVLDLYGPEATTPGTFAANCLLARRLVERGVRFVQVYIRDWDHHNDLPNQLPYVCRDVDQGSAALVKDLKQRGLLEDTLVVWGGEFGRTIYSQGTLSDTNYGRDHHPRCFSIWMAGGGVKPGISYGETDDFSYNITEKPVHIHDLNATMLHCLGIDHTRLTYRFQGRDFRLTDVEGNVVREILA